MLICLLWLLLPENIHMSSEGSNEGKAGDMPENSGPPQKEVSEDDSKVVEENMWPGWPGENVFRMLIPVQKVGGIIGRKGEVIRKITEETKARVRILDGPPGILERAVSCFSILSFLRGFFLCNSYWYLFPCLP